MNDSTSPDEMPLDREDQAAVRWIRVAVRESNIPLGLIDEEALVAYVMGNADESQAAAIQSGLIQSAEFRRQLLELMQSAAAQSSAQEQAAFKAAVPPPLRKIAESGVRSLRSRPVDTVEHGTSARPNLRRGWLEWALGGWAVAATTAASVLFFANVPPRRVDDAFPPPRQFPSAPPPAAPSSPPTSPAPPGASTGASRQVTLRAVWTLTLGGSSRGSGSETLPTFSVSPSTTWIQLHVDVPDVPDGSKVRVSLRSANGKVLLSQSHPVEDFYGQRMLVLECPQGFEPGRYVLTVEGGKGPARTKFDYPFVIEQTPSEH